MIDKIYLTKSGVRKFQEIEKKLKKERQLKLQEEIHKNHSSLSVDNERFMFQEEVNLLNSRISETETILKNYILIIAPPKNKRDVVALGATVEVEVSGQTDEFTIVGTLEADPTSGKLSDMSLVGRALLGHRVGDKVAVTSSVKTVYLIKKIRYLPL